MLIEKVLNHIRIFVEKKYLQFIYKKRINFGKKVYFRLHFWVNIGKNGNLKIGDNCFFNNSCSITALNEIHIGQGTLFGENVKIYDHNHRFSKLSIPIGKQGYSLGSVNIGKSCWIGSNAVILKGANIGDNCVIGAGCIIDSKIPSGTIVKSTNNYFTENIHFKN